MHEKNNNSSWRLSRIGAPFAIFKYHLLKQQQVRGCHEDIHNSSIEPGHSQEQRFHLQVPIVDNDLFGFDDSS
jgi:hypothetical protein